ncbi:MAG: hypothetical protein ACRDWI_13425 [Jiangellaceae bacterium]
MNRAPVLSALIVVLAVACSGSDSADDGDNGDAEAGTSVAPSPDVTTDAGTTSPSPEPSTSEPTAETSPPESGEAIRRDTVDTEVGERASAVASADGVPAVDFAVDEIAVDGTCTSGSAVAPERGHMLVASLTMSTSPELVDVTLTPTIDVSRLDFRIVGPDDAVEADNGTMAAFTCLAESDAMPPEVGPAQTITGKIAFDTEHTSGVLVFRPWWADPAGGWEWQF